MKRIILLLGTLLAAAILFTCAPKPVAEPVAPEAPKPVPVKVEKEGWESEWDKTLQAAKKEGQVLVYTSSAAEMLKEASPSFKKKYGITIDVVSGRGAELGAKLIRERARGLYLADFYQTAFNTLFASVKPSGALDPLEPLLILPEVVDPKMWYGGKLPWIDKDRMVFSYAAFPSSQIAINSKLVKPEEIKSYYDLLEPKWKGKIIINDPTIAGTAFNGFASLIINKILDLDFFRQLVSQQTQMTRDQRLQIDWLARGKYSIAFWPRPSDVTEFQQAGAPVTEIQVKEGTYLSGAGFYLINKRPHPNAARIFINWVLTREAQTLLQNSAGKQSSRVDVTTEGFDPASIRKPEEKYFIGASSVEEWVLNEQDKYYEIARQIFGPLSGR